MSGPSFYWHDYETWGSDPRRDRPAQFAGIRTDAELEVLGEPLVLYCRPADDLLPSPDACLVTGLSPQRAWREGIPEADFSARIHAELTWPGTCGVGYNSIRFDDEISRHCFYRNFLDPYARERGSSRSRWDLIDVLRLAHALRPEGLHWPRREDGATSFRLEHLSAANGVDHQGAHEALADVQATLALARLLRLRQPRLFDYALTLRDKARAQELLDPDRPAILLHVSEKIPAALGCIAPVWPITRHPRHTNEVLVFDLREDPQQLLELETEAIRARLFTRQAELPEGTTRIPLKGVRLNHCPMLAPLATLTGPAAERWGIDRERIEQHAGVLAAAPGLAAKLQAVYAPPTEGAEVDPDFALYSGGFLGEGDRREIARLRRLPPEALAEARPLFRDPRLPELWFRYRARNWPELLTAPERERWEGFRHRRLTDPSSGAPITAAAYRERIGALREQHVGDAPRLGLLDELSAWGDRLGIG